MDHTLNKNVTEIIKRKTIKTMIYFLLIYFLVCVVMYLLQRKLIYHPTPKIFHNFAQLELINQKESIEVIVLNKGKNDAMIYLSLIHI